MHDLLERNATREKPFSVREIGEDIDRQLKELKRTLAGTAGEGIIAARKKDMVDVVLEKPEFLKAIEERLHSIRDNYDACEEALRRVAGQGGGKTPGINEKESEGFDYIEAKWEQDPRHPVVRAAGMILWRKINDDFLNMDELCRVYRDGEHSILDCFEIFEKTDNRFVLQAAEEYLRGKIRAGDEGFFASIAKLASVKEDHFFVRTAVKVLKEEMGEELAEYGVRGSVFTAVAGLAMKDETHFLVRAGREFVAERIRGEIKTAEQNIISEHKDEPGFNAANISPDNIADYIWKLYCVLMNEYEKGQKPQAKEQMQVQAEGPETHNPGPAESVPATVPAEGRTLRITYSEFLNTLRLKNGECRGIVIIPALLALTKLPGGPSDDPLEKFLDGAFKMAVEEMDKTRPEKRTDETGAGKGDRIYNILREKRMAAAVAAG